MTKINIFKKFDFFWTYINTNKIAKTICPKYNSFEDMLIGRNILRIKLEKFQLSGPYIT